MEQQRFITRKRCRWILQEFSTLTDEFYSSSPFVLGGRNWHMIAYPNYKGHLSVYVGLLFPEFLPSQWRAKVRFRLSLVNKMRKSDTRVLDGQTWFDARKHTWGFGEFMPLSKLGSKEDGFLLDDSLTIIAELQVFPLIPEPEEILRFVESLSNKIPNQAADASLNISQGDPSSPVKQKTDNDASPENADYDVSEKNPCVDTSQENSNDVDASDDDEEGSNDDTDAISEEGSDGSDGSDDDDASEEDSDDDDDDVDGSSEECSDDDEVSSSVSSDARSTDNSPLKEGCLIEGNRGMMRCNKLGSVTEAFISDLLKEIQPVQNTIDVNGFQVFSSQVESLRHIFKRHPETSLGFRPKNQQIRRAYVNELLSLIEMLCQSPGKLSEDDLKNANETIVDLIDVGFNLDWLKTKLSEVSEKKKQGSGALLRIMEAELQKLKLMFLDLDSQIQKEKAAVLAARAPLSFKDVV